MERKVFINVSIFIVGIGFADKVYALTKKVPKGKVTTYKEIAKKLRTKAYRAVGTALNRNPYGAWGWAGGKCHRRQRCLVPCHRVVNSDGRVGGFARGIKSKINLLKKDGIKVKNNKIENFNKALYKF